MRLSEEAWGEICSFQTLLEKCSKIFFRLRKISEYKLKGLETMWLNRSKSLSYILRSPRTEPVLKRYSDNIEYSVQDSNNPEFWKSVSGLCSVLEERKTQSRCRPFWPQVKKSIARKWLNPIRPTLEERFGIILAENSKREILSNLE